MTTLKQKISSKIRGIFLAIFKDKKYYFVFYKSYIHSLVIKPSQNNNLNYLTALPNQGAGIGHQMANWISGYWWSIQFGLKYAYSNFSDKKWDDFLGFYENEVHVTELCLKGYKTIRLPLFKENNKKEFEKIRKIIDSYNNQLVIFLCEMDQSYTQQYGLSEIIKNKFHFSKSRKKDKIIYSNENYNIAIHVRRGDIVVGQENMNPNLLMRWQNNDYFTNVLSNILKMSITDKPIAIYLFSQGEESDFQDFQDFQDMHFCLDMNARDSFLHMVYADLLITSKSSFSYKPALLNKGIKVCPKDFWHGYPETKDWILADNRGNILD